MIINCNAYRMLQITRISDRFYLNLKFDSHASSLSTCIFTNVEVLLSLFVLIHSQPLFLLTRNQPKMRCCFVALKQYFRNVLVSLLFLPSHSFILSSSLRRATMVVLFYIMGFILWVCFDNWRLSKHLHSIWQISNAWFR